jgi:hypothetical protein
MTEADRRKILDRLATMLLDVRKEDGVQGLVLEAAFLSMDLAQIRWKEGVEFGKSL